ncbi:hypothetical protein M1O57_04090, partial [Dehalococcoidia bacterium]|nr:hypothetical protein [Dehalococcoidia bacterium]
EGVRLWIRVSLDRYMLSKIKRRYIGEKENIVDTIDTVAGHEFDCYGLSPSARGGSAASARAS